MHERYKEIISKPIFRAILGRAVIPTCSESFFRKDAGQASMTDSQKDCGPYLIAGRQAALTVPVFCINLIVILFFLFACSSQKPAEVSGQKKSPGTEGSTIPAGVQAPTSQGIYSLEITPENALRNTTINIHSKGFNLSDAKIDLLLNDRLAVSDVTYQFNLSTIETKKDDTVQAKALINDKDILSNIITIKNTLPAFNRIKIMPEVFKPDDTLYVDVAGSDADGDPVSISYEWTKNGEPAGREQRITAPIKRGDKISVTITLYDGEAYNRPITLDREIKNLPPMIIEDRNFIFDGKVYTYQVKASDPDGDPLAYSLKSSPEGMTINQTSGLIQWNVPEDFLGKAPLTVSVTDGHGGEVTQQLTVSLELPKK